MAWTTEQLGNTALGFAQQIGGFLAASEQAKSDRRWQKYNNHVIALQAAMRQNVLTTNENITREAYEDRKVSIAISEYKTLASAHVAAAASGTVGRSVNLVEKQIHRNADEAVHRATQTFDYQKLGFDQDRQDTALQAQTSVDLRRISGPSPIALALGLAADAAPLFRKGE